MKTYAGLDVAEQETEICIISDDGEILHQGRCATEPEVIAEVLKQHSPHLKRAVLETGALSSWLTHGLLAAGIPIICTCAREAHGVLKKKPHKSDCRDALMLARMAHAGLLTPIHVRSVDAHQRKALILVRGRLVSTRAAITNAIRGHLKPFGIKLGKVKASLFAKRVRELTENLPTLALGLEALLTARERLSEEIELLETQILALAAHDTVCRRLMSIPGIGPIAAVTYAAVIDDPSRFKNAAQVGNYLGLAPRQYQSGDIDYKGRIAKTGDATLRHLLYECANNIIAIVKKPFALKAWAERLQDRAGAKKARTALARKLAVLMHRLWVKGNEFDWQAV